MTDTDLAFLGARETARRVASGAIAAEEPTEAALARIDRLEPRLNAFIARAHDARREAIEVGERRARAATASQMPLAGVAITVKDLMTTRDAPTTAGSRTFGDGLPASHDAPVVRRLRRAGAVLLGKVNLHEIAMGVTTVNEHFGASRNPWDTERVVGGSSGGSAVAVAAAFGSASVGTDTRGSIRIPASCCGITGLKPTRGLVPTTDVVPLSWTLDHIGPMARNVEDAALMLGVMAGSRALLDRYLSAVDAPRAALRLGVCDTYFEGVDAEIVEAVEAARLQLQAIAASSTGVRVPGLADAHAGSAIITGAEALSYHESRLAENPEGFGPLVRERLARGAAITGVQMARALQAREAITATFEEVFRDVDVLLAPTVSALPPRIGEQMATINGAETPILDAFTRLCSPQNMAGVPALSIPCGFSRGGMPIGLQLIAARGRDDLVLALGAAFQRETDWHERRPPID